MLSSLSTIAILHWALLILPGFNFLLIGQLAAAGQRATAMSAVAGMTAATLMWALLAVAGVGIVFTAYPAVRQAAQIAGGLYLTHLAIKLWQAGQAPGPASAQVMRPAAAFRVGFVTSALNPKIALFYGSVFATSLPAHPSNALVLLAVALVFVNSVVWHSSLALALSRPTVQRAYLRHFRALNKVAGLMVGLMGLKLVVTTIQEFLGRGAGY
ncbi:MAG: LysE family transporter [Candidatus Saccharibacteria bacterium]|nr:LysE family transporter [Rhodoferax sp.]